MQRSGYVKRACLFNLEDTSSQREYRIVTIDRSNIFAGGSSEKEVKREIAEYIMAKLGTGTSFGPYRQYIMDYLLDLVLLARRFDPRGNNLDALLDSLRVVDYKKEKNAIVATVTFVVNGHTVRHTHIAYFLKEKLDENNKGDMLVKDVLEQAVSRSGRTILLSKGHAMLLPDLDTSTESLYPLLKNGTVIVSDDPAEQRKLGFSKVEGKLADLKTRG